LNKERRMNNQFKLKDHLTEESIKQYNETILLTSSLVIFKRG
jgi:hypothetical protein